MQELGVERVYTDRMSGKSQERPELHRMLDFIRAGDSLTDFNLQNKVKILYRRH